MFNFLFGTHLSGTLNGASIVSHGPEPVFAPLHSTRTIRAK
nr:MAG TPA: hypothetical protein [Caudoviricetes sp.]